MRKYSKTAILLLAIFISNSNVFADENNTIDSVYYIWIAKMKIEKNIGHTCGLPNREFTDSLMILTYRNNDGKEVEITDSLQAINIFDSLDLYYQSAVTIIDLAMASLWACGCNAYSYYISYHLLELQKEAVTVRRIKLEK